MTDPEITDAERRGFIDGITAALRTLESPAYEQGNALTLATKRVRGMLESRVRHMQKREKQPRTKPKGK